MGLASRGRYPGSTGRCHAADQSERRSFADTFSSASFLTSVRNRSSTCSYGLENSSRAACNTLISSASCVTISWLSEPERTLLPNFVKKPGNWVDEWLCGGWNVNASPSHTVHIVDITFGIQIEDGDNSYFSIAQLRVLFH